MEIINRKSTALPLNKYEDKVAKFEKQISELEKQENNGMEMERY